MLKISVRHRKSNPREKMRRMSYGNHKIATIVFYNTHCRIVIRNKQKERIMSDKMPDFIASRISHRYGRKSILTDCSIEASKGDCIGIAGRNGCGKSTFLSILAGTVKPEGGSITCFGQDLLANRRAFGRLIGYVPQVSPLIGELTALDNLRLLTGRNYSGNEPVLQNLEIPDLLHTKVSSLSGGMQRRLAIASALAENPPVLVMDEPTSALDLYHKSRIYDNLKVYRNLGGIVIMATHDLEEMAFCSTLYLISGGTARTESPESAAEQIKTAYI